MIESKFTTNCSFRHLNSFVHFSDTHDSEYKHPASTETQKGSSFKGRVLPHLQFSQNVNFFRSYYSTIFEKFEEMRRNPGYGFSIFAEYIFSVLRQNVASHNVYVT